MLWGPPEGPNAAILTPGYNLLIVCPLMVLAPLDFYCSDITVFPDLWNYFGESSVIKSNINDGQNYKSKTQVVMNWNFPLIWGKADWTDLLYECFSKSLVHIHSQQQQASAAF